MTRTAILFCLTASFAAAQWTQLKTTGAPPSGRYDGTVAWDAAGRQLYMFGGSDGANQNDLWALDYDQLTWAKVPASGGPPPARFGHTLVYDSVRRQLLLFGGQAGTFYSDVWSFDIASKSWRKLAENEQGPKSRYGHGAIYDAVRDRLVITHGFTTAGRFDDTWAFDLKTNRWTELVPSGIRPLKRCLFHSVYDGKDRMWIYGGCASGFGPCPLGDLWEFDLTSNVWTDRTQATSPPAREHPGMAFDAKSAKVLIFEGSGSAGLLGDTWSYDVATKAWTTVEGPAPEARSRQEATWVDGVGVLAFGGTNNVTLFNEIWRLGPKTLAVVDAFSGLGGGVAPGEVVSIYGAGLGPSSGVAQAFDSSGRLPQNASITWNGIPSPVYYLSDGQVNAQVPYEVAGASTVTLSAAGATTTIPVVATHPSVFPKVFNADLTVNSPSNPALRGSVIFFFATGQGVTSPPSLTGAAALGTYPDPVAPVTVSMAEVVFKGQAPFTAGVMQVNARLLANATIGDAVPIRLTVGGVDAAELLVAIK